MAEMIEVSKIKTDGGTQSRVEVDAFVVNEYCMAMEDGAEFPPITVFYDGKDYWLADGFHRLDAVKSLGHNQIAADIHQGTRRDAVLYSVGANATHGLHRSNADKRRAVTTMLRDEEWSKWSDREIARRTGVSAPFVGHMRLELAPTVNHLQSTERVGADGRKIDTAAIGKQERHWGVTNGMAFWTQVQKLGLNRGRILESLQPGATVLTHLNMSKEDCWRRLDQIATEVTATRFPVGSYVKHATGRFGKVVQAHPTSIRVLDFHLGQENTWMLDGVKTSSFEEWDKHSSQTAIRPIESEFQPGQVCHTWTNCVIWSANPQGLYDDSRATLPAGRTVKFVQAFQQGSNQLVEVNWGGSPAVIALGGLRAGEPETATEIPPAESGLTEDQSAPGSTNWREEMRLGGRGATVRLPNGSTGTLAFCANNAAYVDTLNGRKTYRYHHVVAAAQVEDDQPVAAAQVEDDQSVAAAQVEDDQQPVSREPHIEEVIAAYYSSEDILEMLPALVRLMEYSEGNRDSHTDLNEDIRQVILWADGIDQILTEELENNRASQ